MIGLLFFSTILARRNTFLFRFYVLVLAPASRRSLANFANHERAAWKCICVIRHFVTGGQRSGYHIGRRQRKQCARNEPADAVHNDWDELLESLACWWGWVDWWGCCCCCCCDGEDDSKLNEVSWSQSWTWSVGVLLDLLPPQHNVPRQLTRRTIIIIIIIIITRYPRPPGHQ